MSLYPGGDGPVVATYLTIRVKTKDGISPEYLAGYLSYLYQSRYWREKAGGASGSMKKITREQLLRTPVPLPGTTAPEERSLDEQSRTAAGLSAKLAGADQLIAAARAELAAVEALPAALLREAFGGSGDGHGGTET